MYYNLSKYTVLIILLLCSSVFAQLPYKDALEHSCNLQDEKGLILILDEWYRQSAPLNSKYLEISPGIEKVGYSLFVNFFRQEIYKIMLNEKLEKAQFLQSNKSNFLRGVYGDCTGVFKRTNYIVVQNKIKLYHADCDSIDNKFRGNPSEYIYLLDFRPDVETFGQRLIYFTDEIRQTLTEFIVSKDSLSVRNHINNDWYGKEIDASKVGFLKQQMRLTSYHWGGGFYFQIKPVATEIFFNKNLDFARITAQYYHSASYLYYKLIEGEWELIREQQLYIE